MNGLRLKFLSAAPPKEGIKRLEEARQLLKIITLNKVNLPALVVRPGSCGGRGAFKGPPSPRRTAVHLA